MKTVLKVYTCKNKRVELGVYLSGKEIDKINYYINKVNTDFDVIRKDLCLIQLNIDSYLKGKFNEFKEYNVYVTDGSINNMKDVSEQAYRKIIERRQYEMYEKFGI